MTTTASRRSARSRFGLAAASLTAAVALSTGVATTAATAAPSPAAFQAISPAGTVSVEGTTSTGDFVGELSDLTATVTDETVTLTGSITGTVTDTATGAITDVEDTFTATVDGLMTDASCDILTLDLGPLNLDALGLVVDLSAIDLDVTGETGPGNLLGNVLCAVTGIFDRSGPLTPVTNLLNRLL